MSRKNGSSIDRPMQMDRAILQRADLTPFAKLVHAYYFDQRCAQTKSYDRPIEDVAAELGLTPIDFIRGLYQLAGKGLIQTMRDDGHLVAAELDRKEHDL